MKREDKSSYLIVFHKVIFISIYLIFIIKILTDNYWIDNITNWGPKLILFVSAYFLIVGIIIKREYIWFGISALMIYGSMIIKSLEDWLVVLLLAFSVLFVIVGYYMKISVLDKLTEISKINSINSFYSRFGKSIVRKKLNELKWNGNSLVDSTYGKQYFLGPSLQERAESLFVEGTKLFENRKFTKAITKLIRASKLLPESEEIKYNLALVYYELKRYDLSKQLINQIKRIDCNEFISILEKIKQ